MACAALLAACGSAAAPQPAASSTALVSAAPASAKPAQAPQSTPPGSAASAAAKPAASAAPAASGTTRMTIAVVGGSPSIANIWVGMDQGIFAKYGLTLELPDMTAPVGTAALLSNQI